MNEYEEYNVQIKDSSGEEKFPEDVVIIPIMNSPIFPGMIAPIILTEDKFTAELDEYLIKSGYLALNLVKNDLKNDDGEIDPTIQDEIDTREITSKDIYKVGVLCKVVKRLKLPDGSVNVLVHGIKRYRASDIYEESPLLRAKYEVFDDILEEDEELDAYTRSIINQVKKLSEVNAYFNEEMKLAMINSSSPGALADLVAFALSLDIPEAQDFLETLVVKKRFGKLLVYLKREKDVADIQKKISDEVNDKVNKYQREYFLREQLKVIKAELGLEEDDKARDISKLKERIIEAKLPEDVLKSVNEEIERLEVIPDSSPEYNVTRTYLNWIVDLPWSKSTNDHVDMPKAQKILEKDHYGLEKAKERIMEFLAVRKLKPQFDGTILCLAGPPGVGKTSMGRSIAESLGRKFYRFSLGGMRDEAEIKGHRRTYVGAMPGRLIQAMKRVEVNNPVIMLDEIDKLGQSFQGDPASALLEVLDPEQNHTFIDHYLDVPFDLSKVLFIATANYIGDIPEPLLDRMEIIELSGYTMEEKLSIATKWVIPKQIKKHGLEKKDINLSKATLKKVIEDYAREPGVRVMEQMVAKLCRRAALEKVNAKRKKVFAPKPAELEDILGTARYQSEKALKKLSPGMTTGLAWTGYGGDILYIETLSLNGKGFKLTGQLGDVMNESANLAYSYVKQLLQNEMDEFFKMKPKRKASDENEEELEDFLSEREVHLHLPAGATPKDGPSAGITMALALYTLAHNVKVKSNLAMTGELSLTGKVLPVGGIKEKVLAAKRAGITNIILPIDNEKDLKEVPERHRKGMKFYPVAHFDEVLKIALPKFKPKFKK
ncbi:MULTISPECIES: endopeptidase La [unclassified Halobacteriovorax]|uniref:endopeptidase La n=1 Tax=unclassified Halobacteriovorax TaxID=2639665 RepID=UPI000EA182FC|nr:endopeptidase La [Halobacteriovorax sp. BALOs_7]AYF43188.1 endopeptidase La [Halobacteriovorax sp. BALOs_7]